MCVCTHPEQTARNERGKGTHREGGGSGLSPSGPRWILYIEDQIPTLLERLNEVITLNCEGEKKIWVAVVVAKASTRAVMD